MTQPYKKGNLSSDSQRLQSELMSTKKKQNELEQKLAEKEFQLQERNKELDCIYQITRLINDPHNSTEYVLDKAINILSASYLYPEISCGRILYGDKEFKTDNFRETKWSQKHQTNLPKRDQKLTVEIFYLKELPFIDNGPFLKEEKNLLETVTLELATYLTRTLVEEETVQNEWQLQFIFNSLQDPIFIHDYNGNFLEVNKMACEKLEYSKEELLTMTPMDIDEPEYAEKAQEIFKEIEKEGYFKGETVHVTKTGTKIPVEINSSEIVYDSKPAILTIARDITERKQYEENLVIEKEKAEESTKLKSAFLANLSHEIRTPLNAILGFSDLMNHENLGEDKRREFIEMIKDSGQKLLSIMNDILEMSFIESNQVQLENKSFTLNSLIDDLIADITLKIENSGKSITCKSYKPLVDGNDVITSDDGKIKQIYLTLLDNALKFTDEGTIEVGYQVNKSETIDFYVSDTGIGIPYEAKELVFERFRQVDHSITRDYEGLGLGLAIASGIAKQLGGSIDFDSEVDKGTTFTFTVPIEFDNQEVAEESQTVSNNDFSGKTILVAEDDIMNFLLVKEFLIDTNADIEHAENGAKAVDLFKELEKVDLVLMDIKMPVLDGVEALKRIKKLNPKIPIIAFTAHAYEKDKEKLLKKGFDEYISKPVKQEELLDIMGSLI